MTKEEFTSWSRETKRSETSWRLDEVRRHNSGELMFYKGGTDGIWIEIDNTGMTRGGSYAGAIPHIGEACFVEQHTRQFECQGEACERLAEHYGKTFLLGLA